MVNDGKREVEEVTQRTIDKGGILVKLYFDMESEKQDDLQPLMADLINNRLLKTPGVVYCVGAIDEPMKLKDTYSTSAQVTALFDGMWPLIKVMFDFTPAGVEILKPTRDYILRPADMQSILLNVAQVYLDYSNYILSRVLKKEDYEKIQDQMKSREELGRTLLDKKGGQSDESK